MSPAGRTRLRLVLRDLSAASAFASIVLSGTVPSWAIAAFGLALLTSLLNRRPLAYRPTISVVVLLITAAILFGAVFRGLLDLVVAACTFAGLVTSHRLLSEATPGTDQQVHLTSLLMLAGGAALAGELWYGACLAAFAMTASISLGLSVIEPPDGASSEHLAVRPIVGRVATGTFIALLGAVAFFVLFPRLSWNLAARRVPPGLGGTTGMSDSVRLGGAGDIKSSPRVVARIRLNPDPNVEQLDRYFPGRSFDTFDGREWRGSGEARTARGMVSLATARQRDLVQQQIELLPGYDSRTLIALEQPTMFTWAVGANTSGSARLNLIEVEGEEVRFSGAANAYRYTAMSVVPERASPTELEEPSRYDQPPPNLDPRVQQLAEHVLGAERRPLQAATMLQRYLQREYAYTLALAGDVEDPLADFLFVRKAGHCEHFATALTLMLRTLHIPARVTAGFFGGERIGSVYVLRAGDAHAWTQVFVEGRGWVTVDATPEAGRRNQPARLLAWITTIYERVEDWWRLHVVDYTFQDQVEIARALVRPPGSAQTRGSLPSLQEVWPYLAALAVAAAVYQLVQRAGGRGRRGRRHPAASFLEQIETRLQRAGIARLPDEAIEELTRRLNEGAHPIGPALTQATRAYLSARFGGVQVSAAERAALLEQLSRHETTLRATR